MNRRRFLQYTIALAGAAATAKLGIPLTQASADVLPEIPPAWVPTPEEVHEWRSTASASCGRAGVTSTAWWLGVASALGGGYRAGRDNLPRLNPRYTGPSNEGFAWHNGWIVGNNDRLGKVTPA